MTRSLRLAVAGVTLATVLSATACTHAMRVRNLEQNLAGQRPKERLAIALEDRSASAEEQRYFEYVHRALAVEANVAPLSQIDRPGDPFLPSRVVRVRPRPAYEGSPWNYLITFPGFLAFTHAWNGFVYGARVDTEVEVVDESGRVLARESVPAEYDLRYTSFARGAVTSSGWYTPGWGGLNLIFGFFMVPYDERATGEFLKEAGPAYGKLVAGRILELAAAAPPRGDVLVPMPAAAAPPVSLPPPPPGEAPPILSPAPTLSVPPAGDPGRGVATASVAARTAGIPPSVAAAPRLIEKLRELKRLHEAGEIDDADYEATRSLVIREVAQSE